MAVEALPSLTIHIFHHQWPPALLCGCVVSCVREHFLLPWVHTISQGAVGAENKRRNSGDF